jgi:signal transduction histidine kinase
VHPVRHEQQSAAMLLIEDMTQQRVAEKSRHEFIAQATHELRAPLTNMRLYIEDAQDRGQHDPTVQSQAINVLNQETFRLERMVEDRLSVSQIEAGAIRMCHDDVRMDGLLSEVVGDYRAQAREKQIELALDLPPKMPVLHGDRDRLMIAIQNLLSNAIEYSGDEPPRIHVSAERDGDEWVISVSDEGVGIDPDHVERVFEVFQSLHAGDRAGTGIGLALCERIVERHGGDIWVESEPGEGATFSFTLPAVEGRSTD